MTVPLVISSTQAKDIMNIKMNGCSGGDGN